MKVIINLLAGLPPTTSDQQWERHPDRLSVLWGTGLLKRTVVICLDRAPALRICTQPTHPRPSSEAGVGSRQHDGVEHSAEQSNELAESKSDSLEEESDEWISGRLASVGLEVGSNGNSIYFGSAITVTIAIMSTLADVVPDTKKTTATKTNGGGCKQGFHRLYLFCRSLFADPASVAKTTELFKSGKVINGTKKMLSAMGYDDDDIDALDQNTHEAVSAIAMKGRRPRIGHPAGPRVKPDDG
jgi:hypothetical protein